MKIVLAVLLLLSSTAFAEDMQAQVIRIHDGDTFTIKTPLPAPLDEIEVRIRHIDTPEMGWRAHCGAERFKADAALAYIRTLIENKTVTLRNFKWDKYARILSEVYVGDLNVGQSILDKKLAAGYEGEGPKTDWCTLTQ
jgi:micrococcal nuclease